ncbi:hypothetical protein AtubIFM57143_010988 [Aspergillus tubingensis]|nr:hypothetical protein AtubIFM57143_010988 [Aspergillus tubingensis]
MKRNDARPLQSFCESKLGLQNTAIYGDGVHACQNEGDNEVQAHQVTTDLITSTPYNESYKDDYIQSKLLRKSACATAIFGLTSIRPTG